MSSKTTDDDDIENGSSNKHNKRLDEIPDIVNGHSNLSASSSDLHDVNGNAYSTMQILRQLWNQGNTNNNNIAANNNAMQTVMRVMMLLFVIMNAILKVPLSYLGVDTTTTADNNDNGNNSTTTAAAKSTKTHNFPMIQKGIVATSLGRVGYLVCDGRKQNGHDGDQLTPILCIHSFQRSSEEYLEVLQLLAGFQRKVVAIDLFSHGMSQLTTATTTKNNSINNVADAACLEVALSLGGMETFIVIANERSVAFSFSLAMRYPKRVMGLIGIHMMSSSPCQVHDPRNQVLELKEDGSHLLELHKRASRFSLDPDLRLRIVKSQLDYWVNERLRQQRILREEGSLVETTPIAEFSNMQEMAKQIRCPTLCIKGQMAMEYLDAIGSKALFLEEFESITQNLGNHQVVEISGENSSFALMNQAPTEFVEECVKFCKQHSI